MAKRKFKENERYAVWTVHGEKCYLCKKPIDLQSMQVDHIIPESLQTNKLNLQSVLESYGLPLDFDLNTFENWLPACGPCNRDKLSETFNPTPIVQRQIQRANKKAGDARDLAQKVLTDRQISLALNKVLRANAADQLTDEQSTALQELVIYHQEERLPSMKNEKIELLPLYEVLSESGGMTTIKGPYGIGGRPSGSNVHPSYNCPNCGTAGAWSGARCVVCGEMDED